VLFLSGIRCTYTHVAREYTRETASIILASQLTISAVFPVLERWEEIGNYYS
jgi:hypothetical protein